MPKVTLTFKLPEEQEDFDITRNASNYMCVIEEYRNWLRSVLKYGSDGYTDEQIAIFEMAREKLWDFSEQYNVK